MSSGLVGDIHNGVTQRLNLREKYLGQRVLRVGCAYLFVLGSVGHVQAQDSTIVVARGGIAESTSLLLQIARLSVDDVVLPAAVAALSRTSGVPFAYSPSRLPPRLKVSCACERVTVAAALDLLLRDTEFGYRELDGQVVITSGHPNGGRGRDLSPSPTLVPAPPVRVSEPRSMGGAVLGRRLGSIVGRVLAANSSAPIERAQTFLTGKAIGAVTGSDGAFSLLNVPPGEYNLEVRRIGFRVARRTVRVRAGDVTVSDFALQLQAVGLDEIVVTGTAGAARRREVGNAMSRLHYAEVVEPVAGTNAMLQGRMAGVTLLQTTGQIGGGASIRLRGNVSATLSNQPLVYVDGVRMRSDAFPKNTIPFGYQGNSSNTQYSPLNDIDPAEIERIEIIKGPAAAALYGTEGAAGVIQIFTKRGQPGAAQWTLQVDQSVDRVNEFGPTHGFNGEPLVIPTIEVNPFGTPNKMYLDPFLRNAHGQRYSLSVSGGLADLQYFVTGSWTDQEGVLPNDDEKQVNVRGNVTFTPLNGLQLNWNTGYSRNRLIKTPTGGTGVGLSLNAFRRDRNYFNDKDPQVIAQVLDFDLRDFIDHITSGVTATYSPTATLTSKLTVGYDLAQQESRGTQPFGFFFTPLGQTWDTRWQTRTLTADYVGSLNLLMGDALTTTLSWGGQSVSTEVTSNNAWSRDFPGPGEVTVNSGAVSLGFENRERVINAGVFGQTMFGVKDRYFLTLGLRVDGNSAFGSNLGAEMYPKVSGSYVVSDESFWKASMGTLKLRAAWGQSGRAPGAFDAVRTWTPESWGPWVSLLPNNVGNPDLGPERSSELELGFDAAVLNDRVNLEFTWYSQKTTDALFGVRQPPTRGGFQNQLKNVGALRNRGIELSTKVDLIRAAEIGWELNATLATNHSSVLDLGGATEFSIGNRGWIVEDQPVPVMRGRCVTNPDELADPTIELACNVGPNRPTTTFSAHTYLRLPRGLIVSARGEYQGGNFAYSLMDGESITRGIRWPACFNSYPAIDAGDVSKLTAKERAMCIPTNANRDFAIFPLDFFRMREVTASVPIEFLVPGANSARLSVSAQNFWRWQKAHDSYLDPETAGGFSSDDNTGQNARTHAVGGSIPIPARFVASIRVAF